MSETEGEWTKWTGGLCPVPRGTPVTFSRRSGEIVNTDRPHNFNWGRYLDPQPTDILAYRVENQNQSLAYQDENASEIN